MAVTVLFYTALRLVQAHLVEVASTGFDIPRDHPERDSAVARLLPSVYSNYRFLATRSQWARYYPEKLDPTPEQLRQYEAGHFESIRAALEAQGILLSDPGANNEASGD